VRDFSRITIPEDLPTFQAMRVIEEGAVQLALVLNEAGRLVGTLTDGDIRRGILNGLSLNEPVQRLMNPHFRYVEKNHNKSIVLETLRSELLRQIPVIDEQGCVVDLYLLEEFLAPSHLPNPVVIMAGGKGTRLRPYTETCPKPMLLVDGKPLLEILLLQCIDSGFSKFFFSVNYLKQQIIDYFQDGSQWGVIIEYLNEDKPLGTAGSLSLLPYNLQDPILILNGDVLTKLNIRHLLNFHLDHQAMATLCVREHEISVPFGVVQTKGVELDGFDEKPSYKFLVNAGIYILCPEMLDLIPASHFMDMPTLLEEIQAAGHSVAVCPIHEYWLDIGRPDSLHQACKDWIT